MPRANGRVAERAAIFVEQAHLRRIEIARGRAPLIRARVCRLQVPPHTMLTMAGARPVCPPLTVAVTEKFASLDPKLPTAIKLEPLAKRR